MNYSVLRTVCTVVSCLIASHARASAPPYVPLATMINRAESIAIVRIDKMAAIERPKNLPSIWWPDHTVTLTVEETLRGSLAKTVTARVAINDYRNPSAKPGERALLFVGRMVPFKAAGAKPKTTVDVFEAAQGFKVLADLRGLKNPKDRLNALSAIRSSIKNYKPIKGMKPYGWGPVLNDEAAKPYFDLLRSKSPALRYWAIRVGLHYVQVTPYIGTRLIRLLSDNDDAIARAVAEHLMQHRYFPASASLREFAAKHDDLTHPIRCYLQARKIERVLNGLSKDTLTRILPKIPRRVSSYSSSIEIIFKVSESGVLVYRKPTPEFSNLESAVIDELDKIDWKTMEIRPFNFQVRVWHEDKRPHFRVGESDNQVSLKKALRKDKKEQPQGPSQPNPPTRPVR